MEPIASKRQLEVILKMLKDDSFPDSYKVDALQRLQWRRDGIRAASNTIQYLINSKKDHLEGVEFYKQYDKNK